ncbi:MAG: hypothetical protein LBT51_03550 [Fusobacteriaceae bacterium]|jgi:hypothetical protein|nr:hypothetical protein [Fusobacteriaceae bacterium]
MSKTKLSIFEEQIKNMQENLKRKREEYDKLRKVTLLKIAEKIMPKDLTVDNINLILNDKIKIEELQKIITNKIEKFSITQIEISENNEPLFEQEV